MRSSRSFSAHRRNSDTFSGTIRRQSWLVSLLIELFGRTTRRIRALRHISSVWLIFMIFDITCS